MPFKSDVYIINTLRTFSFMLLLGILNYSDTGRALKTSYTGLHPKDFYEVVA